MNTKIQAVIFDMDGVLVDSEPLINAAAIGMFQEKGLAVQPEDFLPFVGAGEDRYIGGVAEKYHFSLDLAAAKRRTYEIYLDLVPSQLEAFPGVHSLVHSCRAAGLRVAVASSADKIKVLANLEKIGLPPRFWHGVVTGEQVQQKKPAPDIFLLAAKTLNVEPEVCVVVEDAVNGIEAARAAGMRCIAIASTFPAGRLQEADVVRGKISQLQLSDLAPASWECLMKNSISLDDISIRTQLRPGDIGYVIYMHGDLYKREYGYGIQFETYVAKGLCEFYEKYTPERNRVWVCEHNARMIGFLLLMDRGRAAQLRYFLIQPEYRGIGLGSKLMSLYMDFLQQCGYRESYLWTTHELSTAAALYKRVGFKLSEEKESAAFGKPLREQRYDLLLP